MKELLVYFAACVITAMTVLSILNWRFPQDVDPVRLTGAGRHAAALLMGGDQDGRGPGQPMRGRGVRYGDDDGADHGGHRAGVLRADLGDLRRNHGPAAEARMTSAAVHAG